MPQAIPFVQGIIAGQAGAAAAGSWWLGSAYVAGAKLAGTIAFKLASSVALSALSRALGPKPPQNIRDLQVPTSMPPKRFAYGSARIGGSWAPLRTKSVYIYGCIILNSRPSDAVTGLLFDKREAVSTGDPYDFTGPGAAATAAPLATLVHYWVGLGDQTSPPDQILAEAGDIYLPTDGWRGLTVLWVRLNAGKNKTRSTIWPATPPLIEVDGRWSKVWDPRDVGQDPDDADTWDWSDNQALCLLDALRTNPVRQYRNRHLLLPSFADAADVADEVVTLKSGGTEPRYRVGGALIWDGTELLDQIKPLSEAGGGTLIRSGGQLGYMPGIWSAPVLTLTDVLDDQGIEYDVQAQSRDLPSGIKATITDPDRDWQEAELPVVAVPGASGYAVGEGVRDLPLPFVNSATQGMRIQQIRAREAGQQQTLTAVFPPIAFKLLPGAVVTLTLPSPFTRYNGLWQVVRADSTLWTADPSGGVALRTLLVLRRTAESVYAFVPATDEFDRDVVAFDPDMERAQGTGTITATTGSAAALVSGGSVIPRIKFAFDPSPSDALGYRWEYRIGAGSWTSGGFIDAEIRDGSDQVFGYIVPIIVGESYSIRVWTVTAAGESDQQELTGIIAAAPPTTMAPPTPLSASVAASVVTATFVAPNDENYRAANIFAAYADDFAQARKIAGPLYGAASAAVTLAELVGMLPHDFRDGDTRWTGAASGAPGVVAAPAASITYPTVAGVGPIARFTDVSGATAIPIGPRDVAVPVASRTYRLTARARIIGATTLGTDQVQLAIQPLDATYAALTQSLTVVSFPTDAWTEVSRTWASGGTPPDYIRPRFLKRSVWSDPTAQIELSWLLLEDLTDGTTVYFFATAQDLFLGESAPSASLPATTTP